MKRALCILFVFLLLMPTGRILAYDDATAQSIYSNDPLNNAVYKSYAVMNCNGDRILMSKNGDDRMPVGNLVKLMLLCMAYDALNEGTIKMDTVLKVPEGVTKLSGNTVYLDYYKKETLTVEQALKVICVNSAHDAAYSLALGMAHSEGEFVEKMNKKAEEMGLTNTHFTDCTGRERTEQYSTANDMARIAFYLVSNYPQVTELTSQKLVWFTHSTGLADTMVSTTNSMLRYYKNSTGLCATSDDKIGYCCATSATVKEESLVCVVLGAADDNAGMAVARRVLEDCASEFQYTTVDVAGTFVRRVAVEDGVEKTVKAETKEDFKAFIKVADKDKVEKEIKPVEDLAAPLEAGDKVGEVIYKVGGEELGRVEIIAAEKVEKAGFFTRLIRWFLSLFGLE